MDREALIREWMGRKVRVIVDRPIGYRHGDLVYPLNYGYLPGVIAGDGEEQDCYVLGIAEPLEAFEGVVIGAVRRSDDCEDKLVAAPYGMEFHQGEIREAVAFQEQYFHSTVDALLRKSCGVIPYRLENGRRKYLLLKQNNGSWSFPKGHMEPGETEQQTALRELLEEAGLSVRRDWEKRVSLEYPLAPYGRKRLVLFLWEVIGDVKLQATEILECRWVFSEELGNYLHPDSCQAVHKIIME